MICVEVANYVIGLNIDEKAPAPFFIEEVYKRYELFLSDKRPAMFIDVEFSNDTPPANFASSKLTFKAHIITIKDDCLEGDLDLSKRYGRIRVNPINPIYPLGTFLRNVYTLLVILQDKGIVLHAVGILEDEEVYPVRNKTPKVPALPSARISNGVNIFIGPSKAGKSTVAKLSGERVVLSDDIIIIKKVEGKFCAFPTPDWGDKQKGPRQNRPYPINSMFKLIQDKQVYLERFSGSHALADIFTIPHIPPEFIPQNELLTTFLELISSVPYFGLHFLPEPSFWNLIDKEVNQG